MSPCRQKALISHLYLWQGTRWVCGSRLVRWAGRVGRGHLLCPHTDLELSPFFLSPSFSLSLPIPAPFSPSSLPKSINNPTSRGLGLIQWSHKVLLILEASCTCMLSANSASGTSARHERPWPHGRKETAGSGKTEMPPSDHFSLIRRKTEDRPRPACSQAWTTKFSFGRGGNFWYFY